MTKDLAKKRKKDLGIFYTPQKVVDFIFDVLNIWKDKEDKEKHRWQTRKPQPHFPSVIDPACGEGIFLKKAVESGFTTPSYIWGVDIDESVKQKWLEINLLKSFGSKANLDFHFYHQDGLLPIPEKKVGHKRGGMNQYDAVVGNPPYGGIGINEITPELEKALFDFQIWGVKFQKNQKDSPGNLGLFGTTIPRQFKKKIENFPIEILFIDRFIQLAKPGGWIAIIIPDGILTNSNSHYVREFISHKTKVEGIISLPRNTFKNVGTSAKTSILFLRKLNKDEKPIESYPVFLASLEKIDKKYLEAIVNSYEKHYNLGGIHMDKSNLVQITKDQDGREAVMVRVDKILKELMEEKPFSRLDVNYWQPKWDKVIQEFKVSKINKKYLYEFFRNDDWLISTDHVRASKGESEAPNLPVEYYSPAGFLFTGYRTSNIPKCSLNAFNRMRRAKPLKDDVLLGGFGMGPTGKSLVVWHKPADKSIVGNIFILRVTGSYNPYVLDVFFKSRFGQAQFNKYKTGVAFNSLSNDEIKYLLVPDFTTRVINSISHNYRKIIEVHDKAMIFDKKGEKKACQENLKIAESMLKNLIKRTEEVIEGQREDVK